MLEEDAIAILSDITALLSSGQIQGGKDLFLEYSSQFPESIRLEALVNIAFYERNLQSAVNNYEAAITLKPNRIISRYQYIIGTQAELAGEVVNAFKRYQASIDAEPAFLDAYVELGGLLFKIRDFEGAAQCYRDALGILPSDAANLHNLQAALSQLVQQNADRYGPELKDIEDRLARIIQSGGAGPPQGHSW